MLRAVWDIGSTLETGRGSKVHPQRYAGGAGVLLIATLYAEPSSGGGQWQMVLTLLDPYHRRGQIIHLFKRVSCIVALQVLHAQEKRPTPEEIMAAVEEGDKTAGVFGNLF